MVTALQRVSEMEDRAAQAQGRQMFDSHGQGFYNASEANDMTQEQVPNNNGGPDFVSPRVRPEPNNNSATEKRAEFGTIQEDEEEVSAKDSEG